MTVCRNIICISFTSPSFCANLYIPGWHHAPNRRAMGRHLPFYELIELLHREAKSVATQKRLVSNQKLTRIQRRAYRQLQSKVFGFWQKYENGEKNSGPIIEIDVEIKRRIIA